MKKRNLLINKKIVEKIGRGLLWLAIALFLIAIGVIIQAFAGGQMGNGAFTIVGIILIIYLVGTMFIFSVFLFLILVRHPKLLMQNLDKKMHLLSEEDRKFHTRLRIFGLSMFFMLIILGLIDLIFRKDFFGLFLIFMGVIMIIGELIRLRREK